MNQDGESDISYERITDEREAGHYFQDNRHPLDPSYENYWTDEATQAGADWKDGRYRTVSDFGTDRQSGQPVRPKAWGGLTSWNEVDQTELQTTSQTLIKSITATSADDAEDQRSQLHIVSVEQELMDPLGMGMIDLSTMRLDKNGPAPDASIGLKGLAANPTAMGRFIAQLPGQHPTSSFAPVHPTNPFETGTKRTKVQARANVPVFKILPTKEGFEPELYLHYFHETTSMNDLQRGMQLLSKDLSEQTGQLKQLIKSNFERFISCKDTIDDIHVKLRVLESEKKSGSSQALQDAIVQVITSSKKVFGPALDRHSKAERIKSVMNLLRRFSTLFNTPKRITQLAEAGDYEQIINEYRKTNALIRPGPHTPRIWITLYKEIQRRVVDVLHEMVDALAEPMLPSSVTPDLIRHIIALQVEGLTAAKQLSPVNMYIHHVETHFIKIVKEIEQVHVSELGKLRAQFKVAHPGAQKALPPNRQLTRQESMKVISDSSLEDVQFLLWDPDAEEGDKKTDQTEPTSMVTSTLQKGLALKSWLIPNTRPTPAQICWLRYMVQLSAILLHTIPTFWQVLSSKKLTNLNDLSSDELRQGVEAQVAEGPKVLQRMMASYCSKVSGILQVLATAGPLQRVQEAAIAELATVYAELSHKRSPSSTVLAVQGVLSASLKSFVTGLCRHLDEVVGKLWAAETWRINLTQQDRDPVTYLPEYLREEVGVVMMSYKTMSASCAKAGGATDDSSWQPLNEHFFRMFDAYVACVVEAAHGINAGKAESPTKAKGGTASSAPAGVPDDIKLLLLNSNTRYLQQVLVSHLVHTYISLLAPGPAVYAQSFNSMGEVQLKLQRLAERLEQQFVLRKKALMDKVLKGYAQPGTPSAFPALDVTDISDSARELLHCLVVIQSEVFSYAPSLSNRIMPQLLQYLLQELGDRFSSLSRLTPVEQLAQYYVDVEALQSLMPVFLDVETKGNLGTCLQVLANRTFEAIRALKDPSVIAPKTLAASLAHSSDVRDLTRRMRKNCRKIVQPLAQRMSANFRCFEAHA